MTVVEIIISSAFLAAGLIGPANFSIVVGTMMGYTFEIKHLLALL